MREKKGQRRIDSSTCGEISDTGGGRGTEEEDVRVCVYGKFQLARTARTAYVIPASNPADKMR